MQMLPEPTERHTLWLPAEQPTLGTERLILRPLKFSDAPAVQRLAGAREIAATTLTIPHPYEDGMAEEWIERQAAAYGAGTRVVFGLVQRDRAEFTGAMGLRLVADCAMGELGYWVGLPFWNRGFATEAARELLRFGFRTVGLNRIYAQHFARNPSSGRVMQKLGMRYEATLRQHVEKWGELDDLVIYGILAGEWLAGDFPGL
jgi:ribosomal-protein-alanine N-acetyltransferase